MGNVRRQSAPEWAGALRRRHSRSSGRWRVSTEQYIHKVLLDEESD